MAIAQQNAEQAKNWSEATGATWVRYQEHMDRQLEPHGLAAMNALDPKEGEAVLDIGSGCGATTMALAQRVGPSGRVVGADVSSTMSEVAAARLCEFPQASAIVSDAQVTTVEELGGPVDALFSRFGVMFFADPVAAFANLRALTKPNGRLAFVCWQDPAKNLWMGDLGRRIGHLLPASSPAQPNSPGPFGLADGERAERLLSEAGWHTIAMTPTVIDMQLFGSADLETALEVSLGLGRFNFEDLGPSAEAEIRAAARHLLEEQWTPNGAIAHANVWIITATNS